MAKKEQELNDSFSSCPVCFMAGCNYCRAL